MLVSKNKWLSASARALELALDSRAESTASEYHLWLAADILSGSCADTWLSGGSTSAHRNDCYSDCQAVVAARKASILADLQSKNCWVRAAAVGLLGAALSIRDETLPLLEEHFENERNPFVRATALSSLELLDKTTKWKRTIAKLVKHGDSDPLVYGVATLSWLREDPAHRAVEVLPAIEIWLNLEVEKLGFLVWQDLVVSNQCEVMAWVLKSRGVKAQKDSLDALITIGQKATSSRLVGHLGIALSQFLDRPEPSEEERVIPSRDLTPELRKVAEGLMDSWVYPTASWMPACGKCRRRWLDIDPPSVLEKSVPAKAGSAISLPLWEACRAFEPRRPSDVLLPPKIARALNATDQWRVAVEYHQDVYGSTELIDWPVLTAAGEAIAVDDQLEQTILSLCEEARIRQQLVSWLPRGGPVVSRLLLLPLVRAGRRIPKSLYELVWLKNEDEEREILEALDRKDVAELLTKALQKQETNDWDTGTATTLLGLVDLAPEPEVCQEMARVASLVLKEGSDTDFCNTLRKTARKIPELQAALDRRRKSRAQ